VIPYGMKAHVAVRIIVVNCYTQYLGIFKVYFGRIGSRRYFVAISRNWICQRFTSSISTTRRVTHKVSRRGQNFSNGLTRTHLQTY